MDNSTPYFAKREDLEQCLDLLGKQPLKLIVSDLWKKDPVTEVPWEEPEWQFSSKDGILIKPVFLNPSDTFQFSIASAASRQDLHYHQNVLEIYVSNEPISIEYQPEGGDTGMQRARVNCGFLIVPPGLVHRVELSGITFVFQAVMNGGGVSTDKMIVNEDHQR